ncbi:UPF0052-domain-containing protein [Mycena venus]|uniref:UPF0052-domain-containing protein n=1 Tax=Mycena venus TaxID=2733690 RepID=A0A8H6XGR9_9AGAR|nr:UPF0052-domain-containing protein [Mycena venus]
MPQPLGSSGLTLTVNRDNADSPGSSVFDLPTQSSGALGDRPTQTHPSLKPVEADVSSTEPSFVVISGGTGGNAICSAFGSNACYVLPVSDDGGSSSEIIRVLGGPSIGDIRSRLVRLIPNAPPASPLHAIRTLLAYRLPAHYSEREARDEWRDIIEGRSVLWNGIPNDRKETIRGFLVNFESELLKRAHKNFTFVNGSIGNYFIAAAQGFFRSLPASIFLFSSITNSQANILPVIITNHTVTIAAELENGEKLVGQCEISHPVPSQSSEGPNITVSDALSPVDGMGEAISQRKNVMFEQTTGKGEYQPLGARISRLFYMNAYGFEIHPSPNPEYISALAANDMLVYSCGSLWTSIIPCLALRGVAGAIARSRSLRAKVLLLNAKNDRETDGYTAVDYINAIVRTLNAHYNTQSYGLAYGSGSNTTFPVSAFITDLIYLKDTSVQVDLRQITMATTPVADDVEGRMEEGESPIIVHVVHSIEGGALNMPESPLKKERSKEFLVYNSDAADERDDSSSGDEISIHVESPHDQSLSSSALTTTSTQPETDDATATEDASSPLRSSRVRFRSRVRITSGLHHSHRRRRVSTTSTSSSSLTSSASSSISAPLRSPLTGGQLLARAAEARSAKHRARRRAAGLPPTERTALLGEQPPGYDRNYHSDEDNAYSDDECDGEALLSRQIDLVFGKWPGRLLNRHWWWWQLEPILCCCCLDDADGEN